MKYVQSKNQTHFLDISDAPKPSGHLRSVISLFSGAGGMDIGLEDAGFETKVCVEIDKDCRATLKHNKPEWDVFDSVEYIDFGGAKSREAGDIRMIDAEELLRSAKAQKGKIGLVVGGAPCQPFSNIGKKLGKDDEKNGDLFLEFVRIVKGVEPQAFIFENVVGITQGKHQEVIDYMKSKFAGLGYGIASTILNAANYGVPQKRERFFLIGIRGVANPCFPLPTHFESNEAWEKFASELSNKPEFNPKSWVSVKEAFSTLPSEFRSRPDFAQMNVAEKVVERMKYVKQGENFKVVPKRLLPNCWKSGKHQGADTFGRLKENAPSVTIRTAAYNPSKGRYIHPFENRGLNSIEMARLQDFPLSWEFRCEGKDRVTLVSVGKQIGNAVPPGLARAIGAAVAMQFKLHLETATKSEKMHTAPAHQNSLQTLRQQQPQAENVQ